MWFGSRSSKLLDNRSFSEVVSEYDLDQWIYKKPRWFHLKYRGGTMTFTTVMEQPPGLGDAVRNIVALEKEGKLKWRISKGDLKWKQIEAVRIEVRFRSELDAITFKLVLK